MKKLVFKKIDENSFIIKNFPVVVGAIILLVLILFIYLFKTYENEFIVDSEGFFIANNSNLLAIKKLDSEEEKIDTVMALEGESVYKTPLNVFYNNDKEKVIDINYPQFINNGLTIVNYSSSVNLINTRFERSIGYENLILSYGKAYDNYGYGQIDNENYLLLSYSNGIYINLYDLKIKTVQHEYTIPTNSFVYFDEKNIGYFERVDNQFINKYIVDVDFDSILEFYFEGNRESYKYTYEDVLLGLGSIFKHEEEEVKPKEEEIIDEPIIEPIGEDGTELEEPEFVWEKPSVSVEEFKVNVYSIDSKITVSDPANVIVKEPTFSVNLKGRNYLKRSFSHTGNISITGLSANTTYDIVGQYIYLSDDMETKIQVTFYVGTVKTKDLSELSPLNISHEVNNKYPKKVEIDNLKILSDLESETINGINKVSININNTDYYLNSSNVMSLTMGEAITVSTGEGLNSNSEYNYSINFYDRDGNKLPIKNNTGIAYTSKKDPFVTLKVTKREVDYTKIKITLKNEDNAKLSNYKYVIYDEEGISVASDKIEGEEVTVYNLNANQMYIIKVFADIDTNNGKGVMKNYELASMDFVTIPLSTLGFVNLYLTEDEINENSATYTYYINPKKTDARLIRLLSKLVFELLDGEDKHVATYVIDSDKLEALKEEEATEILKISGLKSNTKYKFKASFVAKQGESLYDGDCIINIDEFETRKIPAKVNITNAYSSTNLIDLDVQVIDLDKSIISDSVKIELRDSTGKLIDSTKISVDEKEPRRLTYNNLKEKQYYYMYFYANEYNETNKNETFKTKYLIDTAEFFTDDGISGNIELISSMRMAKNDNLVDMNSNIKWIEGATSATLHRTYDENGDMHIYTKNGSGTVMFDVSDYDGKMVHVSFKIKKAYSGSHGIYFTDYITGTTSTSYSYQLTGVNNDEWTTYEFNYYVGGYMITAKSDKNFLKQTSVSYGKNIASGLGFYIIGASNVKTEYIVKDFQIKVYEEVEIASQDEIDYESGYWNAGAKYAGSQYMRPTETFEAPENGWYNFKFDCKDGGEYSMYIRTFNEKNANVTQVGYYTQNTVVYMDKGQKAGVFFRRAAGNLTPLEEDMTLSVSYFKMNKDTSFTPFEYDLVTKVKIDLMDVRDEITNDDFFIRAYDKDGNLQFENNYVELIDKISVTNLIKELSLEEHKYYKLELGIKIRERYYPIDYFEMTTEDEIYGISSVNEFKWMQPYGSYVLLNDLDFAGKDFYLGYDNNPFNGKVDFQGYSMNVYTTANAHLRKFYQVGKYAELKNLVLDVHMNHENNTSFEGFVTYNRGLIENVNVILHDERKNGLVTKDTRFVLLNYSNYESGSINKFILTLDGDIELYDDTALLNFYNRGTIKDGIINGGDILVSTPLNSGDSTRVMTFIQYYGYGKSIVKNIYSLSSVVFPNGSKYTYDRAGIIAYQTYGNISDCYVVGDTNIENRAYGPVLGYIQASGKATNLYYMSDYLYTSTTSSKIYPLSINDPEFQHQVLGDGFNIDEMLDLGYYPQVKYTSNMMPPQPYNELPIPDDDSIDIVSTKILEQTDNWAKIMFTINNPYGEEIQDISIQNLTTTIVSQEFTSGNSYVTVEVSNPQTFVSKYAINKIISSYGGKYPQTTNFASGEKYLFIDMYRNVYNIDDFRAIDKKASENYSIQEDIDFYGYNNYYIGTFKGKIKGNNHTLKNIQISTNRYGLINYLYGTIEDLTFDTVHKDTYGTTYMGVIGVAYNTSSLINVHVNNMVIDLPDSYKGDVYAGALVGYINNARMYNCSSNKFTFNSKARLATVTIGGLIGRHYYSVLTNAFATNVYINIPNSSASNGVGGVIGIIEGGENAVVDSVYSSGYIENHSDNTGGIVGKATGFLNNAYSTADVVSHIDNIGGIAGYTNSASYVTNSFFAGNVYTYSSGDFVDSIVPGFAVNANNFVYANSQVDGSIPKTSSGYSIVTAAEIAQTSTYEELINLGEEFDISQVEEGIFPKLKKSGEDELMLHQEDTKLKTELFKVTHKYIDKHSSSSTISITLNNPLNYEITGLEVEDTRVDITNINTNNGETTILFESTPTKFFDSYRLSKVYYINDEGDEVYATKLLKLEMIFYKDLKTINDWQNISIDDAENYMLRGNLNFNGMMPKVGVLFNRLESDSEVNKYTISNINMEYTTNDTYRSLIKKVMYSLKNVKFENITVNDLTTSNNNYNNLISQTFGNVENIDFKDIIINAPNKNYVGIIGRGNSKNHENITLDNITVKGRQYVAGYIAVFDNKVDYRYYSHITATNMHINSTISGTSYAGAVFGYMGGDRLNGNNDGHLQTTYVTLTNSDVTALNGNLVGGISGEGDCSHCKVDNTTVTGNNYVGAISGRQFAYYLYDNEVTNSSINGNNYVGGIWGYCRYTYDNYLIDSEVNGLSIEGVGVGGITGFLDTGYTINRSAVLNSTLTNKGTSTGGILGYSSSNAYVRYNYVQDTNVSARKYAGGLVGRMITANIYYNLTSNVNVIANDNGAGGTVGYIQNAGNSTGTIYGNLILKSKVNAISNAGGVYGLRDRVFTIPQNIYSLYYEGNVYSTDNLNAGFSAGDGSEDGIMNSRQTAFYQYNRVNGNRLVDRLSTSEGNEIVVDTFYDGYINTSTGEVYTNYSYFYAKYSDYIKLEKGKTYKFSVPGYKTEYPTYIINFYDPNFTYLGTTSNANPYVDRYYTTSYATEGSLRVLADCYITFTLYDSRYINKIVIKSENNDYFNLTRKQVLTARDLKNRATWINTYSSNASSNYEISSLGLSESYYNLGTLNNEFKNVSIKDSSYKSLEGIANVSGVDERGFYFDGKDDYVRVDDYKGSTNFTISAKINHNYVQTGYIFYYGNPSSNGTNGYGIYMGNYQLYMKLNNATFATGIFSPNLSDSVVTVTYDGQTVKAYLNGVLVNTLSKKYNLVLNDSYCAYIGRQPGGNYFSGTIGNVSVFSRVLTDDEIFNNYSSGSITDLDNLEMNFDFNTYDNNLTGYYPQIKFTNIKYQKLVPLPVEDDMILGSYLGKTGVTAENSICKENISDNIHIYTSGFNTLNLEFDKMYDDIEFSYSYGDYNSKVYKANDRVYTLTYNFKDDITFNIKTTYNEYVKTYKASELAKKLYVKDNNFYYIDNGSLYKNDKLLIKDVLNLYNNLVLCKDNKLYNLNSNSYQKYSISDGILSNAIPLYTSYIDGELISTYYNFSEIVKDNASTYREGQIVLKDNNVYIFNSNNKNDNLVFNKYNLDEYQLSLNNNGEIESYKTDIVTNNGFINLEIEEITFDINSSDPIMFIRYKDGNIMAINYVTGEKVFENRKTITSLFNYISLSISSNAPSKQNEVSHNSSNKIIDKLKGTTSKEVKEKLNINNDVVSNVSNKYVEVYNSSLGEYEIYDTKELLTPTISELEIISINDKISNDSLLYTYFEVDKNNGIVKDNKIYIYFGILAIVLVNLVLLTRRVLYKNEQK